MAGKLSTEARMTILAELALPRKQRRSMWKIGAAYGVSMTIISKLNTGRMHVLPGRKGSDPRVPDSLVRNAFQQVSRGISRQFVAYRLRVTVSYLERRWAALGLKSAHREVLPELEDKPLLYTETCLTGPVPHHAVVAPRTVPGVTPAMLRSGRAGVARCRVPA